MEVDARTDLEEAQVECGFKELEVVVYIGEFKVVGTAYFGVNRRVTSRRASDYIRAIGDSRLTLSQVRIYDKTSRDLLETVPFILVNLDKVDFLYAREDGDGESD